MKIIGFYTILAVFLMIAACKKEESGLGTFQAKVYSVGSECGPPLIYFEEKDISAVERITEQKRLGQWVAYNLSNGVVREGQIITVTIRKVEEGYACTFMGPTYPHLFVIKFEVNRRL